MCVCVCVCVCVSARARMDLVTIREHVYCFSVRACMPSAFTRSCLFVRDRAVSGSLLHVLKQEQCHVWSAWNLLKCVKGHLGNEQKWVFVRLFFAHCCYPVCCTRSHLHVELPRNSHAKWGGTWLLRGSYGVYVVLTGRLPRTSCKNHLHSVTTTYIS